jgi:uncharacterized membrane protein YhhN
MKRIYWIVLFLAVLACNIYAVENQLVLLQNCTKPLLTPILILFLYIETIGIRQSLKKYFLLGLLFSWGGDVLLMGQETNPHFFLYGLVSFLIAHLFYSYFFYSVKKAEHINFSFLLFFPVLIYYVGLIVFLSPHLGAMKIPVFVYGFVISTMFLLALHMLYMPALAAGRLLMAGALFFVLSDSALAVNKFYAPFEHAGFVVMSTYGLAQLFLTLGTLLFIKRERAKHSLF